MRYLPSALLAPLLLILGCAAIFGGHKSEVDRWHAERLENLRSPTGWLTLIALHPLEPGMQALGSSYKCELQLPRSAPERIGSFSVSDSIIMFMPNALVQVYRADTGRFIQAWEHMETDAGGSPTVLATGSIRFHVIERGGELFLRVKDRESSVLREFGGIDRWPVDGSWRVSARLIPAEPGFTVAVPNVLGQTSESPSPGWLELELGGQTHRLLPMGEAGEPLFLVFGDETNGDLSYGAGRFLVTGAPAADGSVEIDFNRAYNPPCAFTPYATCPLPPEGNVLPVAVTAGEMYWGSGH